MTTKVKGMRDLSALIEKPPVQEGPVGSHPLPRPKEEQAALLRAAGKSWPKIGDEIGLSEKTCRAFPSRQDFRDRLAWLQAELVADAKAFVSAELMPSLERIVAVRDAESTPAQTKLEAATRMAAYAGMTTQAKRVEVTGADGAPLITPTDELALIRAMKGKA